MSFTDTLVEVQYTGKPSADQAAMLRFLSGTGVPGTIGMFEYMQMQLKGWITDAGKITDAGRQALIEHHNDRADVLLPDQRELDLDAEGR